MSKKVLKIYKKPFTIVIVVVEVVVVVIEAAVAVDTSRLRWMWMRMWMRRVIEANSKLMSKKVLK